jgi:hypothetical protein
VADDRGAGAQREAPFDVELMSREVMEVFFHLLHDEDA